MKRLALLLLSLAVFRCASPPPAPAPQPAPPTPAPAEAPGAPQPIGTVRVTSANVNVRVEPSTSSEVVAQVKKGERLPLLATKGDWMNVRLPNGGSGWVSSKFVTNDAPQSARKPRGGCQPDSDYRFVNAPKPAFSDSSAHGVVTVDAYVSPQGTVTSTKVVSNTTGDESLATITEREIKSAKFAAPVRNCVAKAFIFTYKRAF